MFKNPTQNNDVLIFDLLSNSKYKVFKNGIVKINVNGQWRITGTPDNKGYLKIKYKGKLLRAHRIVWAHFYGFLSQDRVVNHIDGNKSNNHIDNLELITASANATHSYRVLGNKPNRGRAKLTWEKVDQIRAEREAGASLRELRQRHEVSMGSLSYICAGKYYPERLK